MKKKNYFNIIFSFLIFSDSAKANYWLIVGTYRQGLEEGQRLVE